MKEVRYLRKWRTYDRATLARHYAEERFAKEAGNLPSYHLIGDHGIDNGSGWAVQSFIEGAAGQLRAATYEENLFCMGCHGSIGATIDQTFSFPRKVDGAAGWGYVNFKGMPDAPNLGETRGEILTYLERAGGRRGVPQQPGNGTALVHRSRRGGCKPSGGRRCPRADQPQQTASA